MIGSSQLVDAARQMEEQRNVVLKASVLGRDNIPDSAAKPAAEERAHAFASAGALPPPYDPLTLCTLFENSNALRPAIDAYAANIDSHGARFEPVLDFEAEDINEQIQTVLLAERQWRTEGTEQGHEPTDADIQEAKVSFQRIARLEKIKLDCFLESCCLEDSLIGLRRKTRADVETTGNAYWEVLRNAAGEIALLVYVPAFTIRLMPLDPMPIESSMRIKASPISYQEVHTVRRRRLFVQVLEGSEPVFFKEFGDRRVISRKTGRAFPTIEDLKKSDPQDEPATEMVHFRVHAPHSAYGIPRWVGTLLEVLGSRQAAEVNYLYFQNKSVPPLALFVSGGRICPNSVPRIESFIENHLKGKQNFHKILVIEAESNRKANDPAGTGSVKIELHPLTDAQQHDALFQNYDERNIDKVGTAFRLPRIVRGDVRDFNRSTAISALLFAEEQVFEPERQDFDFIINRKLLADMGIRFWKFVSNAPVTRDPEVMAETVRNLVNANVLTPEEGRQLASDVFNREFRTVKADWVKQPITLTLAGFSPDGTPPPPEVSDAPSDNPSFAERKQKQMERETVYVSDDEFQTWLDSTKEQENA